MSPAQDPPASARPAGAPARFDDSLARVTLDRQTRAEDDRGTRHLHVIRALLGVLLGLLVLVDGQDPLLSAWRDRGLWASLAMSSSALVFLIYLRRGTPPRWLAYLPPPIDVAVLTSVAMALGGPSSAATGLFLVVIGLNGLMLRQGPLLFTTACVTAAILALDAIALHPPGALEQALQLLACWLAALTTAGVIEAGRHLTAEALRHQDERNSVLRTFGQHVSPQVVDALLRQGDALQSTLRHVSVMFLDIRGFTTMSESRAPGQVVDLLNELFGFMIDEVNTHEGIINKFLGDGFMAVFGAPISSGQDARNAVAAARAILDRLGQEIDRGRLPPLRIGIGVHHGEVVTGSVGSRQRKEYTLVGDVVNVASRVESLNKLFDSQILVTDTVFAQLHDPPDPVAVHSQVPLKGRKDTVTVVQIA